MGFYYCHNNDCDIIRMESVHSFRECPLCQGTLRYESDEDLHERLCEEQEAMLTERLMFGELDTDEGGMIDYEYCRTEYNEAGEPKGYC